MKTSTANSSSADSGEPAATASMLFTPLPIRSVTLPNRVAVSPMCMYAADDGSPNDFHVVHLGRFALGGAGLVIAEATAITPPGRISHLDAGIWADEHIPAWRRVSEFLTAHGAVPGIQLSHAGRRACVREPWFDGAPVTASDGDRAPWQTVGPSPLAAGPEFPVPHAMTLAEIDASVETWRAAATRATAAGFRYIELHGAHGYLLHQFFSPISNARTDQYGGSLEARMRYPVEVATAVRQAIGPEIPLAYRVSSVDGFADGLAIEDTVILSRALAAAGVDVIDTSSGGISTDWATDSRVRRGFAFHADFSRQVRAETGMTTATVGLIVDPQQAELLIERGDADLLLLGREMLDDPNWAQHARRTLDADEVTHWNPRFGSFIVPRLGTMERLAANGETPLSRFEGA